MTTRFDHWSPRSCALAFGLLVVTLLASLLVSLVGHSQSPDMPVAPVMVVGAPASPTPDEAMSDVKVYQLIIIAVASGEDYYDVVAREHRRYNYPLKPYFTIRPPTLAWLSAALGPTGIRLAMFALIGLVAITWLEVLRGLSSATLLLYGTFGLLAESTFVLSLDPYVHFHDSWAALLIALSLALRRPDRVACSIVAGLAAVLFRELALPYLVLMAASAAYERQGREVAGWCAAIAVALVVQTLHANAVAAVVIAGDPASQGWNGLGGWSFLLTAVHTSTLLELLPLWVTALVAPLSMFGWIAWRSALALRVAGLMLGYATALMVFARPDNIYWALMIAPFVLAGTSLATAAVWRLWQGSGLRIWRFAPSRPTEI